MENAICYIWSIISKCPFHLREQIVSNSLFSSCLRSFVQDSSIFLYILCILTDLVCSFGGEISTANLTERYPNETKWMSGESSFWTPQYHLKRYHHSPNNNWIPWECTQFEVCPDNCTWEMYECVNRIWKSVHLRWRSPHYAQSNRCLQKSDFSVFDPINELGIQAQHSRH